MNRKKKIALATLPALALVLLGSSVASAHVGRFEDLTEEQRSALEEAQQLRREGDSEAAREVLKGVGLNPKMHKPGRLIHKMDDGFHTHHEAVHAAVVANDFEAFKNATIDTPFASLVTEDSFAKLVEAQKLRESGDREGARRILQDLGFPMRHGAHERHEKSVE